LIENSIRLKGLARVAPEKGKGNPHMETNSLEVEQPRVVRPLRSDERIPEAKPANPGQSSTFEQGQPPKLIERENYVTDSISDSRFISFKMDDGGDPIYPIRTEVFADIENVRDKRLLLMLVLLSRVFSRTFVYRQAMERRFAPLG
jgi:hypothetical protein